MKITTLLVDDEFHARSLMRKLLEIHVPEVVVVGDADSDESGMKMIKKKRPELVFLDIEMMGANGFEMLDLINEVNFEVVFVTAHDQYALKAFKYDVVDYLRDDLAWGNSKVFVFGGRNAAVVLLLGYKMEPARYLVRIVKPAKKDGADNYPADGCERRYDVGKNM